MNDEKYRETLISAAKRNPRHPPDACDFINSAVSYTVGKNKSASASSRHVRGPELVKGVMEFALEKYGFMAPEVLRYWDIRSGLDVGHIVFTMIRKGILSASPEDRIEDFDCVPDIISTLDKLVATIRPGH